MQKNNELALEALLNEVRTLKGFLYGISKNQHANLLAKNSQKEKEHMPVKLKHGGIRERKDGRWEARVQFNGHRHYIYGNTQKACLEKYKQYLKNIDAKNSTKLETLNDWLAVWFLTYKKPNVSIRTRELFESISKNYIKENIGKKLLKSITAEDLQRFLGKIPFDRTRELVAKTINQALKKALITKRLTYNPFEAVEIKKAKAASWRALTLEEQFKFIHAIKGHKLENLFKFYLLTGCRRTEALKIKWEYVDFKKNMLFIKGIKNETSDRTLPISEELKLILLDQKKLKNDNFVFSRKKYVKLKTKLAHDKELNLTTAEFEQMVLKGFGDYINKQFRPIRKALKLGNDVSIHSLRATFTTRCNEKGIHLKTVSTWLGHTNINTTQNIYNQITNDFSRQQMEKMEFLTI